MKRASQQNFWPGVFTTFFGTILSVYILVEWGKGNTFPLLDFSFVAASAIGLLLTGISSLMASREILRNCIRPYGWVKSLVGMLLLLYGLFGRGIQNGTFSPNFLIALAAFMVVFTGLVFVAIFKQSKQKGEVTQGR